MRSNKRLKYIGSTLWVVLSMVLLHGCIAEDRSDCLTSNVTLAFKYTYNEEGKDLYEQQRISQIDLYVFDEYDLFQGHYTASGIDVGRSGYTIQLMLPTGNYHLVAWARAEGTPYSVTELIPTVTTFDKARLQWEKPADKPATRQTDKSPQQTYKSTQQTDKPATRQTGEETPPQPVATIPTDLYHAELRSLVVESKLVGVAQTCYFTKNTNQVDVVVKHVPLYCNLDQTLATITAKHGMYTFDNAIATQAQTITYTPSYLSDPVFRKAGFRLLKFEEELESTLKITSPYTPPDGPPMSDRVLYDGDLMGLILKNPLIDLRRQHDFVLEFDFLNDRELIISVNGWIVEDGNQDIE